jgi:hypothetical protein
MLFLFSATWRRCQVVTLAVALIAVFAVAATDWFRRIVRTLDNTADDMTAHLDGYLGLVADAVFSGHMFIVAAAMGASAAIIGIIRSIRQSEPFSVQTIVVATVIAPFLAKAIKAWLAYSANNDWLVAIGRRVNDSLPAPVRSIGVEVGLENFIQFMVLVVLVHICLTVMSALIREAT